HTRSGTGRTRACSPALFPRPFGASNAAAAAPLRPVLRELLEDDLSVVEGEAELAKLWRFEPARVGRVVAAGDPSGLRATGIEHRDGVAARVSIRPRVDAEKVADLHGEPGFLLRLARAARFGGLFVLAETAGQRPASLERWPPAPDQKDPSLAVADPRVDRQTRYGRALGRALHPYREKNSRISSAGRFVASSRGDSSYQSRGRRLA